MAVPPRSFQICMISSSDLSPKPLIRAPLAMFVRLSIEVSLRKVRSRVTNHVGEARFLGSLLLLELLSATEVCRHWRVQQGCS
ncbi:hypothetical protein L484_010199 [Morus notabilis]|uniref:Uncharacterized protein n=1 Tax=Morus notabilis TaxID=981085 RepID=W9QSW4_9ROSA|nr:hypothetical protein L484_010199 [Morus notabilis]